MPFGKLSPTARLGVANAGINALEYATYILKLPSTIPLYQQQLVRGENAVRAEWCPPSPQVADPDNTLGATRMLRDVAGFDYRFGRWNISGTPRVINGAQVPPHYFFDKYVTDYGYQIFYTNNEPEMYTAKSGTLCTLFQPYNFDVDPAFASAYPTQASYLQQQSTTGPYRVAPEALARVFLTVRDRAVRAGQGHVVLPPSAVDPRLGVHPDPGSSAYWQKFFRCVHGLDPVSGSTAQPPSISVGQLEALHTHRYDYSGDPDRVPDITDPLLTVARSASAIRAGVRWYGDTFYPNQPLPLDYVLSEHGPDHELYGGSADTAGIKRGWAGGFGNFWKGLSYWNSKLCWLVRRAPYDLNLANWNTNPPGHVLYAMIHTPDRYPYVAKNHTADGGLAIADGGKRVEFPNGTREQRYFHTSFWAMSYNPSMPMAVIDIDSYGRYLNSFAYGAGRMWNEIPWILGPFGACYFVWGNVGADPIVSQLGTGLFYDNGTSGSKGRVQLTVPNGWSTIYIPFIKNDGTFAAPNRYDVIWHRSDGLATQHGYLDLVTDFPNTTTYTTSTPGIIGVDQRVASAAVMPLVVYAVGDTTFELELKRTGGGPGVYVGRPQVYENTICSWFMNQ